MYKYLYGDSYKSQDSRSDVGGGVEQNMEN